MEDLRLDFQVRIAPSFSSSFPWVSFRLCGPHLGKAGLCSTRFHECVGGRTEREDHMRHRKRGRLRRYFVALQSHSVWEVCVCVYVCVRACLQKYTYLRVLSEPLCRLPVWEELLNWASKREYIPPACYNNDHNHTLHNHIQHTHCQHDHKPNETPDHSSHRQL